MKRPNIEAIRKRCVFISKGPWKKSKEGLEFNAPLVILGENNKFIGEITYWDDAEFVAHARMDIPALLAYIEDLESENRWVSINEKDAPKDGSHFLAVNVKESFGIYDQNNVPVMTVVHYFDGHFYPSVNTAIGASDYEEFLFTHWRPLPYGVKNDA